MFVQVRHVVQLYFRGTGSAHFRILDIHFGGRHLAGSVGIELSRLGRTSKRSFRSAGDTFSFGTSLNSVTNVLLAPESDRSSMLGMVITMPMRSHFS